MFLPRVLVHVKSYDLQNVVFPQSPISWTAWSPERSWEDDPYISFLGDSKAKLMFIASLKGAGFCRENPFFPPF